MTEYTSLDEIFDSVAKYEDGDVWDRFLQETFFYYPKDTRIAVMMGFDKLMQEEVKPNRQSAMWLNRAGELRSLHENLSKAGR